MSTAAPHPSSFSVDLEKDKALQDYRIALDFLLKNDKSPDTFKTYRREVDRFILWLWFVRKSYFADLRRIDIESYLEFCEKPPLSWRGTENKRRFNDAAGGRAPNPEWRPFTVTVKKVEVKLAQANLAEPPDANIRKWKQSPSALKSTFAVLRSFFSHMLDEEHVDRNPVAQINSRARRAKTAQKDVSVKRLSEKQINAIFEAIDKMQADMTPDEYERTRFMFVCLLGMYLRISEVAACGDRQPTHGSFQSQVHDLDGNKSLRSWWFVLTGKGNKERRIPVGSDLLHELKRYRMSLGMTPLPALDDQTPLFAKARGQGGLTSTRHVRSIMQKVFDQAHAILSKRGDALEANELMSCTVHWLRHTGISEDVARRPVSHVQAAAGHTSVATTGHYITNNDLEMYLSKEQASTKD